MRQFVILLGFLVSVQTWADIKDDFEDLKNNGLDYTQVGVVCEEVAKLRFQELYPSPQYSVITGVEYSDQDGVVGELDLVVFENKTAVAVVVGEVKCWNNSSKGIIKAMEQRQRFITNVKSKRALEFKYLKDEDQTFTKTQFNKVEKYHYISQKGTKKAGFDVELPYTLGELMQLREDIMKCQSSRQCTRPAKK